MPRVGFRHCEVECIVLRRHRRVANANDHRAVAEERQFGRSATLVLRSVFVICSSLRRGCHDQTAPASTRGTLPFVSV